MFTHKGTQTIETTRLLLRKASLGDAEAMFRNWASDPEVTKYLTWPAHKSVDTTRSFMGFCPCELNNIASKDRNAMDNRRGQRRERKR